MPRAGSSFVRSHLFTRRAALAVVAAGALCLAGTAVVTAAVGTVPGPVTNVVATVTGDEATVSWQPPATGTVARYQIQAHILGYSIDVWAESGTRIVSGSTTSITWDGLPLNHAVYFTITPIGPDGPNYASGPAGPYATSGGITPTSSYCPTTTPGYCVVVDTTDSLGTETRPGAGLLGGAVPAGNKWVGALNLTHWRVQGADPELPQTETAYKEVAAVVPPQNVIEVLSDDWYGHTAVGGYAADPWSTWKTYTTFIASIVSQAEKAGQNPIWEIQNEPENYPYSTAQPPTRALVEQEYLQAYQAIKGVDPNARVIGPSIDWQYENPNPPWYIDMKSFIPFAAANGMKLYAIAWHENGDVSAQNPLLYSELPQAIDDQAEVVRELIAENPGVGSPELFVDENSSASGQFIPGFAAGYFAAEDQAGIDEANRSCWNPPGGVEPNACADANLGELLNKDGNPNPNYWTMVDYGAMSGTRVASEVSDINVSSLAVTDASGTTRVLLGRHETCSQPTTGGTYCTGPSTLAPDVPTTVQVLVPPWATAATVGVQEIPNSLADTPTAPPTANETVPVSNGLATISIPSFGDGQAYFLTVTPIPPPAITSISPASGPTTGGTSVTITGTGFSGATAVTFGTTPAPGFTVVSSTTITVKSPASAAGTVDISVTTAGGTSAAGSSDWFTYLPAPTVTSVSPSTGPAAGGTSVTITGTGFTGATAVHFGTAAASGISVKSATTITVKSPAGSAGTVDVTVTTPVGTSPAVSADRFTYTAKARLRSVDGHSSG